MNYVTHQITDEMIALAKEKALTVNQAPRDINMMEDRWAVGFLGELVFKKEFEGLELIDAPPFLEYDFVYNGYKVDVKTQRLDYPPRESLHFDIPTKEAHRKPDIYAPVFLSTDLKLGHIVGVISSKKFYKEATVLTSEMLAQSHRGGMEPRYTIKLSEIAGIDMLKNIEEKKQ